MWFILLKIFKFGFNQAKKHNANKKNPQNPNSDDASNSSSIPMAARSFMQPSPPPPPGKPFKHYLALALHAVQLVFAIAVLALYSSDIHNAHERGDSASAEWVFAVITSFLGCSTALVMLIYEAFLKQRSVGSKPGLMLGLFVWLAIGVVLWLIVFGIFAGKFLGSEKKKMRRAVWVDLVCLVLAVGAAAWAGVRWWRGNAAGARGGEGVGKEGAVEEEKEVV